MANWGHVPEGSTAKPGHATLYQAYSRDRGTSAQAEAVARQMAVAFGVRTMLGGGIVPFRFKRPRNSRWAHLVRFALESRLRHIHYSCRRSAKRRHRGLMTQPDMLHQRRSTRPSGAALGTRR